MRAVVALMALVSVPLAAAGTPQEPELVDAAGDVAIQLAPAPWQDSDLLAVWFDDGPEGLAVHVRIASVAGVEEAALSVQSDLIVSVRWRVEHANATGRAARDGDWEARADYQATPAAGSWRYWFEGPCKDGTDSDGCAGEDRDIVDDLAGQVDVASNVVTIVVPWDLLGSPVAGDRIHSIYATTQFVYPAYPAYAVDWDDDQTGSASYSYSSRPAPDVPILVATNTSSSSQPAPTVNATTSAPTVKEAPLPILLAAVGSGLAACWRRRQSSR